MAASLARILGTERDKLNCPFYFRIGACRHGDRCSRQHLKPSLSTTLMIPHLYKFTQPPPPIPMHEDVADPTTKRYADNEEFEMFFDDIVDEASKHGEVADILILQNKGEHLYGNCYLQFQTESQAEDCLVNINRRYLNGRCVNAEFSPVTDFSEALCGMFRKGFCERGDFCNFMHARPLPHYLERRLEEVGSKRREKSSRDKRRALSVAGRDGSRSRTPESDRSPQADGLTDESEERKARIVEWNYQMERQSRPHGRN